MPQQFFEFGTEKAHVEANVVEVTRSDLREQIIRDGRVLNGDPIYHEPSREFYEQRIAAYKEALRNL